VAGNGSYYSFSADRLEPKPVVAPELDEIVSLGSASGMAVALGKTNGRLILMRKDGDHWNEMPVPPDLQTARKPRFVPSKEGLAILTEDRLFRFKDDKWLPPASLPDVPKFSKEFTPEKWGAKEVLFGSQFYVGWRHGERGGMLAMIDLDAPEPKWKEVSGNMAKTHLGIIGNDPVTGITIDGDGSLWVCEGLWHLGEMWRDLFRYDGAKWDTVAHGFSFYGTGVRYDPYTTDFLDVFAASDKKLYVLAGALGILTYENGEFKSQLPINFHGIKRQERKADGAVVDSEQESYPYYLVVDAAGNIFVSTGFYGVLCFIKAQDGYHPKQIFIPNKGN
jgi:hypothetical protein